MVDGLAIGPEGERIAIEVKSPRDDVVRGIGQCYEALSAGYSRAVLVNYGHQIAYAATIDEAESIVPWSDPIFESVGSDAYIWDKIGLTGNWVVNHLSGLKRFGKPVNSTEWGCLTYKGAIQGGWEGFWLSDAELPPYDEDEQARYIEEYCGVLNRARIGGAFYTQIDDERLKGYGLYRTPSPASRKKGLYMYRERHDGGRRPRAAKHSSSLPDVAQADLKQELLPAYCQSLLDDRP
jgi:hypothetical protein